MLVAGAGEIFTTGAILLLLPELSSAEVRDSQKDTVIGGRGQAQKESTVGGIITLLMPDPTIDPFPAWKPILCHKDTGKGNKCP